MKLSSVRQLLVKALLVAVVAAAAVAVVAILIGEFNEIVWKSLGTLLSATVHIVILFAILSVAVEEEHKTLRQAANFLMNTAMAVVAASFFTSVFGIWGVLESEWSFKLYSTYAVVIFMLLHAKTLLDVQVVYSKVKPYVYANSLFIALVGGLILGAVYLPHSWDVLSGFYGRLLAAAAIVDVTLSIIVAVMHRLYLQRHPDLVTKARHSHGSARIVVAILLAVFVGWPLLAITLSFAR